MSSFTTASISSNTRRPDAPTATTTTTPVDNESSSGNVETDNNNTFDPAATVVSTHESWPLVTADTREPYCPEDDEDTPRWKKITHYLFDFYHKFDFPIHVLIVILIAWLYPPLGAVYVQPMVTANWIAVCYIFTLFGLGVRTEEFRKAFTKMRFNMFMQVYNFGFISVFAFGVTRVLAWATIVDQTVADGMTICSCLPMSINVGIVLTAAAGGDDAVAIFNTSFGNFVGVFLSPALILGYLGTIGYVDIGSVYMKLSLIVIVPLILGQIIQRTIRPIREFYFRHKKAFKKSAEWALVFIIFTIFSRNFYSKKKASNLGQVFIMIFCQLMILLSMMGTMWLLLRYLYPDEPELRVTGTFIAIQKTIALGVPLITSIYGSDPNLAMYTLPIMVWHPMQLIVGSILVPRMIRFIARERERIRHKEETEEGDVAVSSSSSDNNNDDGDVEAPQVKKGHVDNNGDDDDDCVHDIDIHNSASNGSTKKDPNYKGSGKAVTTTTSNKSKKDIDDTATVKSLSASESSSRR